MMKAITRSRTRPARSVFATAFAYATLPIRGVRPDESDAIEAYAPADERQPLARRAPTTAPVVAAFDMAAAVEVFTVENICDVLGVARSGRGGMMDQSETSATPRPLRLSIHVDKSGWRVIARRPDFRASEDGERFAERALSAAATCRQQRRSLFTYLGELLIAHSRGDPFPALV